MVCLKRLHFAAVPAWRFAVSFVLAVCTHTCMKHVSAVHNRRATEELVGRVEGIGTGPGCRTAQLYRGTLSQSLSGAAQKALLGSTLVCCACVCRHGAGKVAAGQALMCFDVAAAAVSLLGGCANNRPMFGWAHPLHGHQQQHTAWHVRPA